MTDSIWLEGYDEGVPATLEPYPERTLLDYLSESARNWPDRPALLFKGANVTYRQLEQDSDAFAAALVAIGVKRGDRVAQLSAVLRRGIRRLEGWRDRVPVQSDLHRS